VDYRARVEELGRSARGVDGEVAGLLSMLAEADADGGPMAGVETYDELRDALAPVVDRLVALGPAVVDPVVSGFSPSDSPSSGLVAA
jgi:hypothetical protein